VSTHFLARPVGPTAEIKMPEISDILDVAIEDLSPEQLQQLKDATDQFQQKMFDVIQNEQKLRSVSQKRNAQGSTARRD
jgi:hypothetical protein